MEAGGSATAGMAGQAPRASKTQTMSYTARLAHSSGSS